MAPSQAEAVLGRGVDIAALSVRAFAWWAQEGGLSAIALFIDVRSAFYYVFRPLLLGHSLDDHMLIYAMQHLKIPAMMLNGCETSLPKAITPAKSVRYFPCEGRSLTPSPILSLSRKTAKRWDTPGLGRAPLIP